MSYKHERHLVKIFSRIPHNQRGDFAGDSGRENRRFFRACLNLGAKGSGVSGAQSDAVAFGGVAGNRRGYPADIEKGFSPKNLGVDRVDRLFCRVPGRIVPDGGRSSVSLFGAPVWEPISSADRD